MIVKQYIKDFEKLGMGMFVHFGLYSVLGRGEWAKKRLDIPQEEYEKLVPKFKVNKNWAHELVRYAKIAGCKYITLTTRHHDGFSLYDTCGLNTYDAPHSAAGRDLIREFVDECNKQGVVPFFYHTLIDWWKQDMFDNDFKGYLQYLRDSVEILCKNYGKIGGLWFDGKWAAPDADWEEDALYGVIRKYQPEAMIINNTGMGDNMGVRGNIEIDSLTYERGRPGRSNNEDCPKYLASEMCEIFGWYWGYAPQDLSYKPVLEILDSLLVCRKNKANFLLNVGPMGNGMLCNIDKGYLERLGVWVKANEPAIRDVDYVDTYVSLDEDYMMYDNTNKCYYLVVHHPDYEPVTFELDKRVKSISFLDDNKPLEFTQEGNRVTFKKVFLEFGIYTMYRVAKIVVE